MSYQNLDKLEEYIKYRNMAFESKLFEDVENPLPRLHFCNNQKYLDAFSQDIIHGNNQLMRENAGVQEMLYNTLVHRVLLNKQFCRDHTDNYGIFRINDHEKLIEIIDNYKGSFAGRYRNMMQNRHLAKMSASEFFDKIITTTMPEIEKFNNCNQSDIWNSSDLRNNAYQCGPFTQYQLSSDLMYIPLLDITPDYINYSNLGTANGFHHLTGKHDWDKEIIDLIMDINSQYDHKTELTEIMVPSDANNVLCEFYKYDVSKKTRYRQKEIVTHDSMLYEVPENLRKFKR